MSSDPFHTLLIRVDPEAARKLKLLAAYEDESMSELMRRALDAIIQDREKKKAYRDLFSA